MFKELCAKQHWYFIMNKTKFLIIKIRCVLCRKTTISKTSIGKQKGDNPHTKKEW